MASSEKLDSMMIERFTGKNGRYFSIEALKAQTMLLGDDSLAEAVYENADIFGFESGDSVIEEFAPSNEIYFILSGVVSIRVGGREVAARSAGQHFGEMAMLGPGQPRSASAVAKGEMIAARLDAVTFSQIADSCPVLWRNIAKELASRLRERNRYVSTVNPSPVIFVGCSIEALSIGRAIQSALDHDPIIVRVWSDGVFQPSSFPVESLEHQLQAVDFAALVLSPDDTVISRSAESDAPRDNLIFELGLFMGALGRKRTFLVVPRGVDIKIPTDVMGITPIEYEPELDPRDAVAVACNAMRNKIMRVGPK